MPIQNPYPTLIFFCMEKYPAAFMKNGNLLYSASTGKKYQYNQDRSIKIIQSEENTKGTQVRLECGCRRVVKVYGIDIRFSSKIQPFYE